MFSNGVMEPGEELAVVLVEAGGDGAAAFEALEEVLHLVALPVAAPIMTGRSLASHAGRNAVGVARVGHDT